jgi:hypothetical protein
VGKNTYTVRINLMSIPFLRYSLIVPLSALCYVLRADLTNGCLNLLNRLTSSGF